MTSGHGPARESRTVTDSPLGPLLLVARDGALAGLYMNVESGAADEPGAASDADAAVLAEATRQLAEYFDGQRQDFDLPLDLAGTAFQRRVWRALRGIGYGETASYGEIAAEIGQPTAARAVGLANGRNPVSIVVPCHRVIGADGGLTGYGWGVDRKAWLLAHERDRNTTLF
jgi:methylated-DNA-[protein]-cysteine S-methyltransferase